MHLKRSSTLCKPVHAAALLAAALILGIFATSSAHATHHRYGHISWTPGANPNEVNFVIHNAWRRNQGVCIDPNTGGIIGCTGPGGLPGVGDIHRQGVSSPSFVFGDGTTFSTAGGILHVVTSIDEVNNWYFGTAVDHTKFPAVIPVISKTYANPGSYLASFQDCCRISGSSFPNRHINNPDRTTRIQTTVNIGENGAPLALIPPVVLCGINTVCNFNVAAAAPAGQTLRYRLAGPSDIFNFAFDHPGPPHAPNAASIDPNTGVYSWDTTGASLGGVDPSTWNVLYSTQVVIEGLDAAGVVVSTSAVDFMIRLVPVVGTPPEISQGPCGQILNINVGSPLMFTVEAFDDPGDMVTLNVVGLPVGAMMTPTLPTSGNPVTSDFSWTPGPGQVGTHIVTFSATDQLGQAAPLCSVTIVVSDLPPGPDCVYTQGFWKNHFELWPVASLDLGNNNYTDAEVLAIFDQPVRGNGLVSLARQLAAALLNQANGASTHPGVQQAIDDAHALIGNLVIPPHGAGSIHPSMTSGLTEILDMYNNGSLGTPHCGQ